MAARWLLCLALLLPAAGARAQFPILGHPMDRSDLGYDWFFATASPAYTDRVRLKGADDAFLRLELGEFSGFNGICVGVADCRQGLVFRSSNRIPPHAYGIAFTGSPFYGASYVATSLFEPDQVIRKTGKNTQLILKQKASVMLLMGSWNDSLSTGMTTGWRVPGCKAQAKVQTRPGFAKDARFKVSCRQGSIDDVLGGSAPILAATLQDLGLRKPKLDFRGNRPGGAQPLQIPFRTPGHDLDRNDLGYDFFIGQTDPLISPPAGGPPVALKGVGNVGELRLRLRVGEATGNYQSICSDLSGCFFAVPDRSNTWIPAFAYGYAGRVISPVPFASAEFVAASLWEPDQVKRKASGKGSSVAIKQKKYVLLVAGLYTTFLGPGASSWAIEGCKGQAQVKTGSGKQTSKLKVQCSDKAIDAALTGSEANNLRSRLDALGLRKTKLDFRGRRDVP